MKIRRHHRTHQSRSCLNILCQNKLMLCLISFMVGYFIGTVNNKAFTYNYNGDHDGIITSIINEKKTNRLSLPFERTELKMYLEKGKNMTDTYTYFHNYMRLFGAEQPNSPKDFETLPLLHIWPIYFEAYNNHWHRYRGKEVVFMEIGVQSGGKIPLLRDYFGKGLTYVGVDINKSTKKFESADWIHIEIGSSEDPEFWAKLREKYPKVDLFLDDGGHTMNQQRVAMKEMLPHVQPDGVYMCEDLSTSWSEDSFGFKFKDSRDSEFLEETMVGLVHRSMDWLQAGWIPGKVMWEKTEHKKLRKFWSNDESWWLEFHRTVRHIHYYNQLVVYEKGYKEPAFAMKTIGEEIPYEYSGEHKKVDWGPILDRVSYYTNSAKWFQN